MRRMDSTRSLPRATAAGVVAALCALLMAVLSATAGAATVTIVPGETLSHVATRQGVSVAELARANGIANPDRVVAGTRLDVPGSGTPTRSSDTATRSSGAIAATAGTHRVRAGETLSSVASRYGTSARALARQNGRSLNAILSIGTRLSVPGGASSGSASASSASGSTSSTTSASSGAHRVTSGETLSGIAARYGLSASGLARANGLSSPNLIVIGQRLSIPGGSGAEATAPATPASSSSVASLLDQASARHGVPADLARAVAWQESGWQQSARSSAGAIGVMQLMPTTATWFGSAVLGRPVDPHSVGDNVDAGVAYLSYLTGKLGDQRLAVGAYYRGPNAVRKYGLGTETRAYVSSVMALRGTV